MIAEFKGQNGKIIVYDDHIVLSRSTIGGFITQGGSSGDRKIFYQDMSSFEYKRPNFFGNGYFKVILPGTRETNAAVGLLGSSFDSAKDGNTVILRAFSSKVGDETDRIYKIIIDKLTEAKKTIRNGSNTSSSANPSASKMDELKKLGELKLAGVLTEEEFQKEKEKLLSN